MTPPRKPRLLVDLDGVVHLSTPNTVPGRSLDAGLCGMGLHSAPSPKRGSVTCDQCLAIMRHVHAWTETRKAT